MESAEELRTEKSRERNFSGIVGRRWPESIGIWRAIDCGLVWNRYVVMHYSRPDGVLLAVRGGEEEPDGGGGPSDGSAG